MIFLPAADNEGPMDECGTRGGRTQTLHRTPTRLQGPPEDRWAHTHTVVIYIFSSNSENIPRTPRHYAADGILSGRDPGLTGESEVQRRDGYLPATGL